jgi:hypothetical protein
MKLSTPCTSCDGLLRVNVTHTKLSIARRRERRVIAQHEQWQAAQI